MAVLGAASRQAPLSRRQVELCARDAGDLAHALPGDKAKLHDPLALLGPGQCVRQPCPQRLDFIFAQHAIARRRLGRLAHSVERIRSRYSFCTAQRTMARTSSKTRVASTFRLRFRIVSVTVRTSRRRSSLILTAPMTGTTFLRSRRSISALLRSAALSGSAR